MVISEVRVAVKWTSSLLTTQIQSGLFFLLSLVFLICIFALDCYKREQRMVLHSNFFFFHRPYSFPENEWDGLQAYVYPKRHKAGQRQVDTSVPVHQTCLTLCSIIITVFIPNYSVNLFRINVYYSTTCYKNFSFFVGPNATLIT